MTVPKHVLKAAEDVYDGWFARGGSVHDWEAFIDRLESSTDHDFGASMMSADIIAVKRHINAYRKLES